MKRITWHPDADKELTDAAQYYESRQPGLGKELLAEVEQAPNSMLTNPEAFQKIGKRVRRKPLWRFPYNLIYAVYPDAIRIGAFAHQKRRPFYWRKRVKETSS